MSLGIGVPNSVHVFTESSVAIPPYRQVHQKYDWHGHNVLLLISSVALFALLMQTVLVRSCALCDGLLTCTDMCFVESQECQHCYVQFTMQFCWVSEIRSVPLKTFEQSAAERTVFIFARFTFPGRVL